MDEPPATDNLVPTHGIIRQWVDLYGPKSEAPIEGHLGAAIALISAAVGYKLPLQFGRNTEPCTVNIVLEGESASARKTTTANVARDLARKAADPSSDDPGLYVDIVSHTSDRGLIELVAPKDEREASHWDRTVPPGHLIVWDEFGPLLGDPGQNRKGSDWLGRVRGVLLQLTNGYQSGLKTGQAKLPASRCAVSILATVTRKELEQRISLGLLEDGFMGRFALIPMRKTGVRFAMPPAFSRSEIEREEEITKWLQGLVNRREGWGNAFDLFTSRAREEREAWYMMRRDELDAGEDTMGEEEHAARTSAFNRLQALAVKVAGIHAISQLDNPLTDPLEIRQESVVYGQRMVDMILVEIMDLAILSGPLADQYAIRVVRYLMRQEDLSATKEDVMRHVKMGQLDRRTRWAVVEGMHGELVDIRVVKGTGGRPRTLIVLRSGAEVVTQSGNGLSAPLGGNDNRTLIAPSPQSLSGSGVEPYRTFDPSRARVEGSVSRESEYITHKEPGGTEAKKGDTPEENKFGVESPPRRATPDDDIPF